MKNPRRILVAIKDPKSRKQPALAKAAQLATAVGAQLDLYHAISTPLYLDAYALEGQSLQQIQKDWRERALKQLEKLATPLRAGGLSVTVASEWDFPAYEAVIRRSQRVGADLIVAERHATQHMLPWLLRFNDWELLRRSSVPVLLIKSARGWTKPAVLAAIDPSHSFAKPARLDNGILGAADMLSAAIGAKLHVAHAWNGSLAASSRLSAITPDIAEKLEREAAREARKAFDDAVAKSGARVAKKHFVAGSAVDVIPSLARKQGVSVVVMGAISRSGLKRLVVGNVAEQVLDALPCDVLVLKPVDFKARVPASGRGVQLIPTPPYI